MAARRIKGSKMKYWGFYASEELKATTIECAKKLDVGDSEYIRLAVEHYNTHHQQDSKSDIDDTGMIGAPGFHKNNSKPTIPELEEKVKEMESPKKSFRPCPKGGK
jgi:hypothetical protein